MSMEKAQVITDTHTRSITALGYNPNRHELLAGCEDGVIKVWDYSTGETGKLLRVYHEHEGWVTAFLFWSDAKVMFSSSIDGSVLAWGSGIAPFARIQVSSPIYSMCWNSRREQLILGMSSCIQLHSFENFNNAKEPMKFFKEKGVPIRDHKDIVKSIVCHETRIFTAGFDRKLIIYDSYAFPGKKGLKFVCCVSPAHEAAINTLVVARDVDNNTWLFSGSFDKSVKVWSLDGQLIHKLDTLGSTVTGLCYVRSTRTIWIASGYPNVSVYDPKSGDNISEFVGTYEYANETDRGALLLLYYIADLHQVFGTNTRRHILIWKYNPFGCVTALKSKRVVETLTYTRKVPILFFSGDTEGQITKWERLQSNTFMYSTEVLPRSDAVARLAFQISERYDWGVTDKGDIKDQLMQKSRPSFKGKFSEALQDSQANISLICSLFVEDLDLLIVSSEDHNIYVWGFDDDAVRVLQNMRPEDSVSNKFSILLEQNVRLPSMRPESEMNGDIGYKEQDSVTNRVAGFICKQVFAMHTQVVTAMALVGRGAGYDSTFLLSTGWDRRICLWDIEQLRFKDSFRNPEGSSDWNIEIAADGVILDMEYSLKRNEFAYSSVDKLVYIRKFSTNGAEMTLSAVLQGHEADVTQVKWFDKYDKWVTGSCDGTIRLWSANGMSCDSILSAHGIVNCLCIDVISGCIVAGVQDSIKVYNPEVRTVVQTNIGHTDAIRCIIHIVDRNQYVSASWDKTVRIWNAYKQNSKRKGPRVTIKGEEIEDPSIN